MDKQLDEAVLIRVIRRSLEAGKGPLANPSTGIEIIAAFYGQNVSWLDVTDKVHKAVKGKAKWSAKVSSANWGKIAPQFKGPRTLLIRYLVNGKTVYKRPTKEIASRCRDFTRCPTP